MAENLFPSCGRNSNNFKIKIDSRKLQERIVFNKKYLELKKERKIKNQIK
jgi:hypothetical protein